MNPFCRPQRHYSAEQNDFALLNNDVEVFLNELSFRQLGLYRLMLVGRQCRNRKRSLGLYIINVKKLISLFVRL